MKEQQREPLARLPLPPMTDLTTLRDELRLELAGELPLRLHVGQGASPAEGRHTVQGRPEMTYGHMTGLPFARQFDRYLSGEHGGDFLASDCFAAIRDQCRKEHWREQHTGPDPFAWNLCSRLAIAYVELRQPVTFIAAVEGIDAWLVRNLLTEALKFARDWRSDRRRGVIITDESRKQLNESEALPVVLAREHDVEHEARVWELWRERFPYLRSWDSELVRRRAFHATHCHGNCALLLAAA